MLRAISRIRFMHRPCHRPERYVNPVSSSTNEPCQRGPSSYPSMARPTSSPDRVTVIVRSNDQAAPAGRSHLKGPVPNASESSIRIASVHPWNPSWKYCCSPIQDPARPCPSSAFESQPGTRNSRRAVSLVGTVVLRIVTGSGLLLSCPTPLLGSFFGWSLIRPSTELSRLHTSSPRSAAETEGKLVGFEPEGDHTGLTSLRHIPYNNYPH
jgi:hypothetical protein